MVTRARIQEIYETGNDCCEVKGDHTRNRPRVSLMSVLMRIEAPSEDWENQGIYMWMKLFHISQY